MSTTPPEQDVHRAKMSHRQVMESLAGILLGMFVSMLATSIVSSSLPRVVSDLKGSPSSYTWVVTATLLTTTISTPIWGKLADLTNRKLLIQIALTITVLSSAAAGFSHSVAQLITFRAFQGIGAGGLTALATILIADIIAPRERGKYMSYTGAVMAVSMVGGPLLGGFLTDSVGWRWNFFFGLPFAIAAILVLQKTLHLPKIQRRVVKIDYWGAAAISGTVALLLLWVTFAGKNFEWLSWQTFAMVGGALVLLIVAGGVESHASEPIIPLHLFRNRTFVLAVLASVAVGLAMFGTTVFISQYMQISRGESPTMSGLLSAPMVVGVLAASMVVGPRITRTGHYKRYMLAGSVLLTAGILAMATIDYQTNFALISVFMVLLGLGVGMLMQNLVLAVQNSTHITEIGAATSSVAFFRSLGGTIGVSVLGAIMTNRVEDYVKREVVARHIDPRELGDGTSLPEISTLHGGARTLIEQAYGMGVARLFLIAAPLAALTFLCVLFIKEIPLGTKSGVEQRLAADAAVVDGSLPEPVAAAEPAPTAGAAVAAVAAPTADDELLAQDELLAEDAFVDGSEARA